MARELFQGEAGHLIEAQNVEKRQKHIIAYSVMTVRSYMIDLYYGLSGYLHLARHAVQTFGPDDRQIPQCTPDAAN